MNIMKGLTGKMAVVTGGNSGIGYAAAKALIDSGAQVVVTGRNGAATEKAANELGAKGVVADQSNLASIKELESEVRNQFGKIDVLFLNAGAAAFAPIQDVTEAHYDQLMNANVKGTYFTLQQLLSLLNDGGSVIFNTSVNATLAAPGSSIYAASKAALLSISKVLAGELAVRKIRVNAISPGPVATPLYGKLGLEKEQVEGLGNALGQKILLKRFAQPEEIAKAVLFLASDDSSFITGTELVVDGGLTVNTVM
ncbi:SDR family oxidoreductase [Paraflavitalea sp. CAU 1676]|uniref:SDR family oxidoreductase n=1 Tax=Paraflavitalea sp. CAU 1676 TaxID=3032598 RepID=UPI0023DBF75D|nr:SDR family oxidoreductase [Paraflavitalea sp. CAU 1676]MDF2190403.1 SDR family oxidoreductase [Paraflavitalea sp. CAU 1676]